jgi:hypothetical protein
VLLAGGVPETGDAAVGAVLGRRVYAAGLVTLACLGPWVAASGAVPRRTLRRWLTWWRTAFANTAFWRTARARFVPLVDEVELPLSLVNRFRRSATDIEQALLGVLVFVSPITGPAHRSLSAIADVAWACLPPERVITLGARRR